MKTRPRIVCIKILYLILRKKEAQGRGAMSFPEALYLKGKETVWKRNL